MLTGLYLIIIQPIISFLEFLFSYLYCSLNINTGVVIGIISFIISSLCLPFYLKAEKLQNEEKAIQKKMADRINCIKKHFKGDERYFLLQTCYKQNHYHPIMSLRLSLSLLLQIPFFIAAYTFFSHLDLLDGMSVSVIKNVAQPDNLLMLGSFHINALPILMTLTNLAAGFVYTGDTSFKNNKTLYAISLVFLVLLYNSPAGLVLYWTFNNLYSYFKNICLKYGNEKVLYTIVCYLGAILFCLIWNKHCQLVNYDFNRYEWAFLDLIAFFSLFFICFSKHVQEIFSNFSSKTLFCLSSIFLWILLGILIPTNVFSSSPAEFLFSVPINTYKILLKNSLQYFGLFIFWGSCIFYVLNEKERKSFSLFYCLLGLIFLLNLHFWKLPNIPLLNDLTFNIASAMLVFSVESIPYHILYFIILLILFIFIYISVTKKFIYLKNSLLIVIIAMLIFAGNNTYKIISTYKNYNDLNEQKNSSLKLINLSKTKKNVVFFFLDKTPSLFFPFVTEEFPELKKSFKGFNYYPNTVSFARYSITGYLPMFGGYEYSPNHIDERKIDFLTKHNEAVTLLPVIFKQNNYNSRIVHPMNNAWYQHNSQNKTSKPIQFNDLYEKYSIEILMPPKFYPKNEKTDEYEKIKLTTRNLFFFSLMSVLPEKGKKFIYKKGRYFSLKKYTSKFYTPHTVQYYLELKNLINFTEISSNNNTFTIFCNWLGHEPNFFTLPNYEMDEDNIPKIEDKIPSYFDKFTYMHYHTAAAQYILMSKWLDYLKKEGVYDNTRIIIVSDHGYYLKNSTKDNFYNSINIPINPILLVKDFNSNHALKMDNYELMTNADAPFFAFKDIIDNPKNPFTGKIMSQDDKSKGLYIKMNGSWDPDTYLGKKEVLKDDDIFGFLKGNSDPTKKENWRIPLTKKQLKQELNQK